MIKLPHFTPPEKSVQKEVQKSLYPLGEKLTLDAETSYSSFLIHHFGAVEMISKKRSIQTLCKVGTISPPQIAPVVIALPRETDHGGPLLSSRRKIIQNILILYLFLYLFIFYGDQGEHLFFLSFILFFFYLSIF